MHGSQVLIRACVGLLACSPALRAAAQLPDCGSSSATAPDFEATPADRAEAVALNAPFFVRYGPAVDVDALEASLQMGADPACDGELVCLFGVAGAASAAGGTRVLGSVQAIDLHTRAFVPDAPLSAHAHYLAEVARAGFDRPTRAELSFTTGETTDREPPKLDSSAQALELSVTVPAADCHAKPGSLRVVFSVPRATDDGDEGSVELLLYLTRADGLTGPLLAARERNPPSDQARARLAFLLSPTRAADPVCVAFRARDGLGRLSNPAPERCFDPSRGAFFAPCQLAAGAGAPNARGAERTLVALWAACALALFLRARTRSTNGPS